MRILLLANNDGGLYKFRREVVEALLGGGNDVFISLPFGNYKKKLEEMGCQLIDTSVDRRGINPIKDSKLLIAYINLIKKVKPHIVLTYTIKPNIYGGLAAAICRAPYIANVTGMGTALENSGALQKMLIMMYKAAFGKIQCVFFQNDENKRFFERHRIAVGKHKLIPGSGVNLEHFSVLDYPSDDTTEFVFISRIMKEKGIEQYFDAAKYIKNKYPQTGFHICGACEEAYENTLKELQEQGVIEYHGVLSDVREIHKIAHCTIHPTYYPEGMSNVLLESCACGRPIITTNRSGCREIVDNGVNGYVVKEKASEDLIEKIEQFLSLPYDKKKQMGLNGRKKVEREFDRQIVVKAYLDEVNSLYEEGNIE